LFTALINPAFNHRGASVWFYLKNGNPVTLESIAYGFAAASAFVAVILWFSCFLAVVGSDKLVYLFGRLSPALALLFTMALRMVPRFFEQLAEVRRARALLGNGAAKGIKARAAEAAAVMSALASWSIEGSIVTADAMRARGYGLPGRTAYSPFVFTRRDGAARRRHRVFEYSRPVGRPAGIIICALFPDHENGAAHARRGACLCRARRAVRPAAWDFALGGCPLEAFTVKNLTFSYPGAKKPALENIGFTVRTGEFVTLCGRSGCGKTTLLRQQKPALTPFGEKSGRILFGNTDLESLDERSQAAKIGFVMQSAEAQLVTDKVWHELAFTLESLGTDDAQIRLRVAETAGFFGMRDWFDKDVAKLSGGQKQLLNLASVMAAQPTALLLDEPTSQLDPVAASDFLSAVVKINRELGVTVILCEQRLEDALAVSDRMLVLDEGRLLLDAPVREGAWALHRSGHPMFFAMPAPARIFAGAGGAQSSDKTVDGPCPVTVREGRQWLEAAAGAQNEQAAEAVPENWERPRPKAENPRKKPVLSLRDVWFRYEKDAPDVLCGLTLSVFPGEHLAVLGANGAGKSTALGVLAGMLKPMHGSVRTAAHPDKRPLRVAVLPQACAAALSRDSVFLELWEMLAESGLNKEDKTQKIHDTARELELELDAHPHDLSGGEQQRAVLAKLLLRKPDVLLLDEPTKGMDAFFKEKLAVILRGLTARGAAVVSVSHDVEFCARYAGRCALFSRRGGVNGRGQGVLLRKRLLYDGRKPYGARRLSGCGDGPRRRGGAFGGRAGRK
jgi:energy-coupling factor transport system ATP-binding protein